MPVPEDKIYNDAPDEFAEFLDSGRCEVSLEDLGGEDNPFVKAGIYRFRREEVKEGTYCPCCGAKEDVAPDLGFLSDYDEGDEDSPENPLNLMIVGSAPCDLQRYFSIDHNALAEFMSKGLGCTVCRQFKKTGWQFGKLRGYDVYFACRPTEGMYRALESAPKSVLVIGQNTPKTLPSALATRVIYLSRLLFVKDGELQFANEVIEEKIPMPRAGVKSESGQKGKQTKKHLKRWPIQAYAPYYLTMMSEWLDILRRENKVGKPTKEWITEWLYKHGASPNRKRLSERQIYRHIDVLSEETPPGKGKLDRRATVFGTHWNGCEDKAYVETFSVKDLTEAILKAVSTASKLGFDIKPMRNMDAADFADKSDGKFGQKRNYRTHVD